jgi:hypothetical protein
MLSLSTYETTVEVDVAVVVEEESVRGVPVEVAYGTPLQSTMTITSCSK